MGLKGIFYKIVSRAVLQPVSRVLRGKTLGVRIAVIDAAGRVLLVRHSYAPGWMFPGGGVEVGETFLAAAKRELREEVCVAGEGFKLHGIFCNDAVFPGDNVACYTLRQFIQSDWKPSLEISDARFFALQALPEDVTGGTRRRLAEIFDGFPISEFW